MARSRDVRSRFLLLLILGVLALPIPLEAAGVTLDPTFAAGAGKMRIPLGMASHQAQAVAVQADGKTVLLGSGGDGSEKVFSLVRHNADGSLDVTFGTGGTVITRYPNRDLFAHAVAIQADGKIVAAGDMRSASGAGRLFVARYLPTGVLDSSFGGGGFTSCVDDGNGSSGNGVAIQADGRIVVAGSTGLTIDSKFVAYRFDLNGAPDATFGSQGSAVTNIGSDQDIAYAIAVLDDGTLILTGLSYSTALSVDRIGLVKYDTAGHLDTSFSGDGIQVTTVTGQHDIGFAVAIQQGTPDKILVGASSAAGFPNQSSWSAVRYNLNGTLDTSFDGDGRLNFFPLLRHGVPVAMAIQYDPDGTPRILFVGQTYTATSGEMTIVRRLASGAADNSFDGDGVVAGPVGSLSGFIHAMAVTATRVITAGYATTSQFGNNQFLEARYDLAGTPDPAFDGDGYRLDAIGHADLEQPSIALQADGRILLAERGDDNHYPFTLVRRLPDGSPDLGFGVGGFAVGGFFNPAGVTGIVVQADGGIIVVGSCTVSRYLASGMFDPAFGSNGTRILPAEACFDYSCVGVEPDGKILVAGKDGDYMRVVRLKTDGTVDSGFGIGGAATVNYWQQQEARAIAVQPDGGFILGGNAGPYFGIQNFAIARFNQLGILNLVVDTPIGTGSSYINGIALQPDGRFLAVGYSTYGFGINTTVARYTTAGLLDTTFNATGIAINDLNVGTDYPTAVARENSGNFLVAGTKNSVYLDQFGDFFSNYEFTVLAYRPNGTIDQSYGLASVDLGDVTYDIPSAIMIDALQRAVVVGPSSGYLGVMRLRAGAATGVPPIERPAGMLEVGRPFPNPSREGAVVPFTLAASAPVRGEVIDAAGRLVRNLVDRPYEPGRYALRWDGIDENGAPVPDGIYFLRVTAGAESRVERVVIVR